MYHWDITYFLTQVVTVAMPCITIALTLGCLWRRQGVLALVFGALASFSITIIMALLSEQDAYAEASGQRTFTSWNGLDWYWYATPAAIGLLLILWAAVLAAWNQAKGRRQRRSSVN